MSYLGYTQWALLADPPPELVGRRHRRGPARLRPADSGAPARSTRPPGWTTWSQPAPLRRRPGTVRGARRGAAPPGRRRPGRSTTACRSPTRRPLSPAAPPGAASGPPAPTWTTRTGQPMRHGGALERVSVPVLLSVRLARPVRGADRRAVRAAARARRRRRAHRRAVDAREIAAKGGRPDSPGRPSTGSTEHLAGRGGRRRPAPVRVFVTGADEWRDLPALAAAHPRLTLFLRPGGGLGRSRPPPAPPVAVHLRPGAPDAYGRRAALDGGARGRPPLAARADVLAFTGDRSGTRRGASARRVAELGHASDNPHADLFVRLSEVDATGPLAQRHRGLPAAGPRPQRRRPCGWRCCRPRTVPRRPRIRLLVAGGSHPQYGRNLGTAEPRHRHHLPARHTIDLGPSRVLLPVPDQEF